ncbi:hypothetical protein S7335_5288 [Synechococcus sp. PCC 7335]|nr:hypothetical protein S7335_5288 [Synechococcus sp. PCC 7335]
MIYSQYKTLLQTTVLANALLVARTGSFINHISINGYEIFVLQSACA